MKPRIEQLAQANLIGVGVHEFTDTLYEFTEEALTEFTDTIIKECSDALWSDECNYSDVAYNDFTDKRNRIVNAFQDRK